MKKLTLFLVATLFSALSFAALNPYAYGLSSSLDGTTLTVNYSLNAPATAVSVVIMDGETEVKTVTCDGITKGTHSINISTLDLPTGKSLTWKVNVTGAAVAKATAVKTYRFFHPSGIDVDNNPESSNFGRILCLEANHSVKTTTSTSGYLGKGYGAGIYAFDPAFEPIHNGTNPGFNGNNQFVHKDKHHYPVRRIRISDDGRIFVTAQNDGGCFLWEVNPDDLNSWTKVFEGTASTYTTTTSDGKFIAGTNSGFDVHGSGENLKLLMLSASVSGGNSATFRCDEYDLGTAKTWSTVPSRTISGANYHIVTNQSNVQYDKDGGVWHIQYRGTCTDALPGLVHINKDGVEDYKLLRHNTRNAGFCFNKDFTKVIVAGKFQNDTGTQKYATIYAVSKDVDGKPVLTEELVVDMTNIGAALNDFAWDYADNIYAVDNSGEYLCAYALPHAADKVVSTPCASKYAFEVEEVAATVYTLTTNVVGEGTVEGNLGTYEEGSTATLTATPADHYEFTGWTGDVTSTDNPLTITVNSDLTVTANFQEHTKYTITANAADNTMGYVTGGGTYYVGENVTLKAVAKSTYYFVNWSDGSTDATRTITVTGDLTLTANFAKATPRAWAYDLKMVEDGDKYKFSFTATTAANATLLFLDKEGNELYAPHNMGAVAAGANTVSIEKAYFTQVKDVYWSVKMDGEAITSVAEITDQSRNIYDFYNMQGVVVDNDPNSEKFGEIYIEMAKSGTTNGKAQTLGLFLLNQNLDVLNTNPNVGIQPTMPDGYVLNGTNYTFQRLNIHPKTGDLVFSYGISSKPAVFAIDRENMTGSVTNLLDGITGLTKTVAHCFDAEGTLYVMDLPGSGTIYKIKDGAKSTFAAADSKYAASNITMASDGRGGLWVAHNRGQMDSYYQLAHYNALGTVDFAVYQGSENGFTGYSTRGALAYDAERQILAQGRNNAVEVFSVAYDATTGVPSLTKIATTPIATAANIDGIAFDYAGDLYVVNSGNEKFNKYTLPTAENICTIPAPESQAIIKEVRYTITVNTVGNGSATGAGEYVAGETATLEASPAANHQFVNWTYGSETSTDNPLELVVNSDITVTANFAPVQYTLIAPTNDENKGTVTGAGTYNHGTEVTLTATPKEGYKLLYWSDRSTENPRTITMTKNEAISAYFVKEYTEEPTFTIRKVWENTQVPTSTGNGFQAVGWNQKIYMQDAGNQKIMTFTNETGNATEYAASGSGQQIAVDEVGNLIVFNAYFATATPGSVLIYQKGSTTGKVVDFTLPNPARCDFFSASGNIFSAEGGYVYFYCNGKQVINRLKITNGAATAADVMTDIVGGSIYETTMNQNHVMVDIFGNLVTHARANALNTINVYTNEVAVFTNLLSGIKTTTLGGCSFELGGKELWAYNVGTTNFNSEWNIYNITDTKFLSNEALYVNNKTLTGSAANWLNVQVVDENTAYIYQFCPKVGAAVWEVKMLSGNLHTVTVVADNGTVDGNAGTYEDGATATLTAKPNTGYKFVNWTKEGTVVSTDATYTFTVTEDVTLVANFEALPQYTITATSNDAAMGTVTGGGTYYEGTEVTLTASAVGGYVFSNWSDGNTDNPRTIQVTADATYTANFKVAIARVFAYNLDMIDNGDSYTFSFIPNANAISGQLIVYNDSKAQVLAQPITSAIVKGVKNEMTISKTSLPAKGTWAIELTGEPVESLTLLTKANDKTNYGFNRPQGVAIDNSPESDYFGRMYIALPKAGGTGYSDTNYGIVVMDPLHNRLKSGVVANGDAWGNNGRYSMHRIAVNPTNGHVYYVRTSDSSEGVTGTAIYELTPNATSVLTDGGTAKNVISGVSEITNANSVCFDETGAMFVVANASYDNTNGSTGRVYKVVNGIATLVTQSSRELASKDNSIVPDGKGGFWIAQHRNNLDGFNHLLHIDASGNANYTIDNATNTHLLPVQTYTKSGTTYNNASYRGQVAYYSIDENNGLVAYGGGAKVSVFKATYDGSGAPTLESWQTISLLSSSSTEGINVDGLAFDYAGNLIVMSATDERMYQYALPTNNNTSIVPAKSSLSIGEVNKITYELNGGVWNKYGWTSKKDMYDAFIADWKAYSGSTRATKTYEEQYGIGKSNNGIPVTIQNDEGVLDFMELPKWSWLAEFLDALAISQNISTKIPSSGDVHMRFALGNFFGEDNNKVGDSYVDAVDCSGDNASLSAFAPYWGQTFPLPTQPTEEIVLNAPYKEGYLFDGWYATSNFSGEEITVVDENTNGTLYAKWLEHRYTRSVTSGDFGTICLPYGSSSYNGAEFYEIAYLELQADGVTPKGIWLDEVTGALEAGKPYIFKATNNLLTVNYEGVEVPYPIEGKAGLTGTFDDITDDSVLEGNYMINKNQFWLCGTGCWLNANRAYIEHDALHAKTNPVSPLPGRRRVMMGAAGTNQATGIDHLTENGAITPTIEGTYDVLGRKFTEPNGTGFYIVNGKKVVIVK